MTANEIMKSIKDNLDSVDQNLEQIQCDDCISRQAAIDVFKNAIGDKHPFICEPILITLSLIPSVTPQPKTGYWIVHEIESTLKWLECSNCHCETSYNVMHNYCPNCGAKMEVSDGIEI